MEVITYNIIDNGAVITATYFISKYVPDIKSINNNYEYLTILDSKNDGLLLRIRNSNYARDIDFKAITIQNRLTIDDDNKKFFIKGSFYIDKFIFKDIRTGSEFNTRLMDLSFDTYLAKKITDIVKGRFETNRFLSGNRLTYR